MLFTEILQSFMPCILNHPFNQKLADESLPISVFNGFLTQDTTYLKEYARALNTIAHRLQKDNPTHAETFHYFANGAINTENILHQTYFKKNASVFFKSPPPSEHPAINAYIQHLHETTQTKPIPVAIAAVLPCFMIYRELGIKMPNNPEHRFYDWIKTYSDSGFLEDTEKMIAMFDAHDQVDLRDQALQSFTTSVQHEINFWDSVITPPCIKTLPNHCVGK